MNRNILAVSLVALVAIGLSVCVIAGAQDAGVVKKEAPKSVDLTGVLGSLNSDIKDPGTPGTPDACKAALKAGDPAVLMVEKGTWFVLASATPDKPLATQDFIDAGGAKITVTGKVYKHGGLQVIFVEKFVKAADEKPKVVVTRTAAPAPTPAVKPAMAPAAPAKPAAK